MIIKANQVLTQVSAFDCNCGDEYKKPLELTDNTPIYIEVDQLGSNLILGTFASSSGWTIGANWAVSGGKATYTSGGTNSLSRDTDITLVAGYYLIKFDYTTLVSGGLFATVSLGGTTVSVLGGALATGFTSQTFYLFKYLTPSNNTFSIQGQVYSFEIDNLEIYRLEEVGFDIKDCDTDAIVYSETNNASVSYYETGNILNGEDVPTTTTGYATVTFDWDGYSLPEECYYLCFNNPGLFDTYYLRNGGFADDDFWSISNSGASGWAIGSGVATHTPGGTAGDDVLSQSVNLSEDLCYGLAFEIASVSGSGSKVFSIYDQNDVLLGSTTVSNFPYTYQLLISNKAVTTIKIVCNAGGLRVASIDNAVIQIASSIIDGESSCEVCVESDCISLRSDWDAYCEARKMCNILVTGTNTNSAFGFPANYSFKGRVFGKIRNARYPDVDNTEYRDLSGLVSMQYNENDEVKELQIYEVPERVHDWLRLALRSQSLTLEINGVSKSFVKVGGDYTPNWRKTSELAPVIVEIKEAQQLSPNARNI